MFSSALQFEVSVAGDVRAVTAYADQTPECTVPGPQRLGAKRPPEHKDPNMVYSMWYRVYNDVQYMVYRDEDPTFRIRSKTRGFQKPWFVGSLGLCSLCGL